MYENLVNKKNKNLMKTYKIEKNKKLIFKRSQLSYKGVTLMK